ncbi:MAG: DUF4231 domain-containing protein [Oscillatoria sp. SIO1A7]|nr:DUF4231 domain-containing protein [Oscillatoria sp. SIO1A7]
MSTSEIVKKQNPQTETFNGDTELPNPGLPFPLKILQYLSVAAIVGFSITGVLLPGHVNSIVGVAFCVGALIFLFLLDMRFKEDYAKKAKENQLSKKANLRNLSTLTIEEAQEKTWLNPLVKSALQYSQDLIDDYKRVRVICRNAYYILQLGTVILSGVTPILVLVDKLETDVSWFKWLPVICPALASIIASVATSFGFQEKWTFSNKAVELLEAEQEKFVLGVSNAYQDYDITEDKLREKSLKKAISSFISKVNVIHLKQMQEDTAAVTQQQQQKSQSDNQQAGQDRTPAAV